jgi:hypothetical protein
MTLPAGPLIVVPVREHFQPGLYTVEAIARPPRDVRLDARSESPRKKSQGSLSMGLIL